MISCMYIRSCIWVIGFLSLAGAVPWADPSLELLDELNDAEVYRAVVNSMNEWQNKHDLKKITNRTKREDPSICYKGLGCFEASGPFGYLDMLPSKPEEINTRFLMYPARTRRRRSGSAPAEVPFEKLSDAFEWAKSGFNKSLPTKVLIHGFGSDCGYIWAYEIRSALMAVEEVNTICVDWSNGASLPNYVKASANTRLVGKQLSLLLRGMVEKNGLSLRNTHLIGFSLGAHIAGFTGADLGNLSRITGLDPAGPLFESQDTRARLDETDAAFVDVIHSNGENLILGGLGSSQPMGHVDFYPNGGRMQKGCSHLFVGAVSDIIWSSAVEGRSLCNHRRAYKFFIDSVSPRCHFPAFPCKSYDDFIAGKCFPCTDERKCGNMGYYADRSKGRGQLYLITRDEEPFCAHQYLVKIESTPSPIPIKSYGKIQITLIGDSFLNETFMMTKKEDEEMKLGESISRILVPHPILSQPTRIEILYTAYSGWLSSGLTQWKLDKVTLMDSFGKVSSVCKKSVLLESGKPETLSLHPGECNPRKDSSLHVEAEDRMQQAENKYPGFNNYNKDGNNTKESGFTPTQVVRVGLNDNSKEYDADSSRDTSENYMDGVDVFGIPWKLENENNVLDSETESSRAFNSRIIKADKINKNMADSDGPIREIVEPILKPHSSKNARSHDPDRDKPEITEPILGPTTARSTTISSSDNKNDTGNEENFSRRKMYLDSTNWMTMDKTTEKWKRQDESKALGGFGAPYRAEEPQNNNNPLDAIVTTVQFLPQRLARMFEQAEKYARETILPLVSTYTPRFISDFIGPRETPRYVPLHYDEDEIQHVSPSKKVGVKSESQPRTLNRNAESESGVESPTEESVTTPYSHIQRITKKKPKEKIEYIFPTNQPLGSTEALIQSTSTVASISTESKDLSRKARDEGHVNKIGLGVSKRAIYINLPVFDDSYKERKYIPVGEGPTITPTSKNTNTYSFNRANSHFSIEIDTLQSPNARAVEKKKRQDDSRSLQNTEVDNVDPTTSTTSFRPLETLVNAIQSLPGGLTRMLTQAQNFTRANILPLMENYSPMRLTDLLWIRPRPNVTMDVYREKSNNSQTQEDKVSINWSMERIEQETTEKESEESSGFTSKPKLTSNADKNIQKVLHPKSTATKLNESVSFTENSLSNSVINSSRHTFTENFSSIQNINNFLGSTTENSVSKPLEATNIDTKLMTSGNKDLANNKLVNEVDLTSKLQKESTEKKKVTPSRPEVTTTSNNLIPLTNTTSKHIDSILVPTRIPSSINTATMEPLEIITSETTELVSVLLSTTQEFNETEKAIRIVSTSTSTSTTKSVSAVSPINSLPSNEPQEKMKSVDAVVRYVSKTDSTSVSLENKYMHVQRIPKKGEKIQYSLPKPFTIVIDPNDLTSTSPSSTSSTTVPNVILPAPQKAFVSYIQKIPKKGEKLKKPYNILRAHPLVKDIKVHNKIITLKNQYGVDMTYRITSDGRFEI